MSNTATTYSSLLTAHYASPAVDPRQRLRLGVAAFWCLAAVVFARVIVLERHEGDTFRAVAAAPLVRQQSLPGVRGRILARDGSVLAHDEQLVSLAVRFRQMEEPANPVWLKSQARARLPRAERRNPQRMAEAQQQVLADRRALHERLAELCGLTSAQWQGRAARIQSQVQEIARRVNRRQAEAHEDREQREIISGDSFWQRADRRLNDFFWLDDGHATSTITVAEELDAHVMAQGLPLDVVAEIEAHPERYPGVQIVYQWRRSYPAGPLAAHVLGHLGAARQVDDDSHPDDRVGRMGIEQQYEHLLRGRRGAAVETLMRNGESIAQHREREPTAGRDLLLTLDLQLQRTAESLLDSALQRRASLAAEGEAVVAGGAIVVLDVHNGAVLAAASAPRFDPNAFAAAMPVHASRDVVALLDDPAHPLFDRAARMALPPGSVFKVVTAIALQESGLDAQQAIACRGYLHHPDVQRCAIFTRRGIGHGPVTLGDAVAQSCNVFFFHTAGEMGPGALVDWSRRFGYGQPTGIDVPGEAAGQLPSGAEADWRRTDTQALAIGQSRLTATPLQVVRTMAAIANGGMLVTPHLVAGFGLSEQGSSLTVDDLQIPPPRTIDGLSRSTLATLCEGLERVVADPQGTAHDTVHLEAIAIAGKTGTAQAGDGRDDHAWFAGYCPADAPRVAFVVVLEHAGDGGEAAGPVARRLVERMQSLGYFKRRLTPNAKTQAVGRNLDSATSDHRPPTTDH